MGESGFEKESGDRDMMVTRIGIPQDNKNEENLTVGFLNREDGEKQAGVNLETEAHRNYCINCMHEKPVEDRFCRYCGFDEQGYVAPSYALPPHTILHDRYVLGKMLGAGGFGITYLSLDKKLARVVAVKEFFIRQGMFRDCSVALSVTISRATDSQEKIYQISRKKFESEARMLARLEHVPGIVRVYDFFEENSTAYMVMEYLSGKTLKSCVKERGRLPVNDIVRRMNPIMDSLDELHQQGIFHRDISPDNIMTAEDGTLTLFDFGGAKISGQNGKSSMILEKSGYSPLEQLQSAGEVGPWTDVYALAATIYYCITGKVPPEPVNRVDVPECLKLPSEMGVSMRKEQETALSKALALRYRERYQTVAEFKQAINVKYRSHKWIIVGFVGIATACIAAGAWYKYDFSKLDLAGFCNKMVVKIGLKTTADVNKETETETPAVIIYPHTEADEYVETDIEDTEEDLEADTQAITDIDGALTEVIDDYNKGILSYGEAVAQLSDLDQQENWRERLDYLKQSKEAYQKGSDAARNGKKQEAIVGYGGVIEDDVNYSDAQQQIDKIKESEIASCKEDTDILLEEERYGEAIDRIDSAIQLVPDSEELALLRSQCISDYTKYAISYSEMLVAEGAHEEARSVLQEAYGITGDTVLLEEIDKIDVVVIEGISTILPDTETFKQNTELEQEEGDSSFYLDGTVVPQNSYILPNSDSVCLTEDNVRKLTHKGIRYAINEIYARNGYTFVKKQELKTYFGAQAWYDGGDTSDQGIVRARMNSYEIFNADLLVKMEKQLWGGEYQLK